MPPPSRKAPTVVVGQEALSHYTETFKNDTRLLGEVQRWMLKRDSDERDKTVLHPSEICRADWCPRSSYYAITGTPALPTSANSFVLENIFDEGHDIHTKWQTRWRRMGVLRGQWLCCVCEWEWQDTSPEKCPNCKAGGWAILYREVPLYDEDHNIGGHADGDINDRDEPLEEQPIVEVKSIGIGTVRMEQPELLVKHTHKVEVNGSEKSLIDYQALWRDIRRPLPVHLRQGCLYGKLAGRRLVIFMYECKWNQQVKEFIVRPRPGFIERILDEAKDVKYYLKQNKPPPRPGWALEDHETCKSCVYRDTCYQKKRNDEEETTPVTYRRVVRRSSARPDDAPPTELAAPTRARVRDPERPAKRDRPQRRRADEPVRRAGGVGGLLGRPTGDRRDR